MSACRSWMIILLLGMAAAACRGGSEPAPVQPAPVQATVAAISAARPTAGPFAPLVTGTPQSASADAACTIATPCADATAPIESSTVETATVEPAAVDSAAPDSPQAEAIDALLATVYDGAPFRGAVLVARQGEVLLRRGVGSADAAAAIANTPQTRFRLGSLTKPITALAILKLQAAGRLDVAQPVCGYLTSCPPAWAEITLHHLLSHTSGIPDFTRFADFSATTGQATTPLETLARFADRPLDFTPGSAWDYSNSNYIVLGIVIEQVTGQPYAAYVQDAIFAPLGMNDSGYDTMASGLAVGYRPDGSEAAFIDMSIPFAAGGLYSSVDDIGRLMRALAGVNGVETLLPDELRERMWTAQASIPGPGPAQGYGYGWVVSEGAQGKVVSHNGSIEGFSAGLRYYLQPDLLIVALSNEEQRNPNLVLDGIAGIVLP